MKNNTLSTNRVCLLLAPKQVTSTQVSRVVKRKLGVKVRRSLFRCVIRTGEGRTASWMRNELPK